MALPQEIISVLEKIEEKDLINKFYEFVEQNQIPFYVKKLASPNAVALRSGVYVSNLFINKFKDYYFLFAMLHESAHYLRYNNIDYDLVQLTDLPFEEFLKKITIEEDYADDLAETILMGWINELNLNEKLKETLIKIQNKKGESVSEEEYEKLYIIINHFKVNYKNNTEQLIFDLMNNNLHENILRAKISKIVKKLFESPEVAPAEPITKPKPKEQPGPKPRRILKPHIHPGADPKPKAKHQKSDDGDLKKKINLKEAPLDYVDPELGGPSSSIKSRIEKRQKHPYSNIDILHKDVDGKKTIEKLGDEEYKDVADRYKLHAKDKVENLTQFIQTYQDSIKIQFEHKAELENLAKSTVQKYFGVPQEVMDNIFVKLTTDTNEFNMDDDDDEQDDMNFEDIVDDFTEEEQEIIKHNVNKRIISNTLMMGAGFRSHNLLDKIKPELDKINKQFYPIFSMIMSKGVYDIWKAEMDDNDKIKQGGMQFNMQQIKDIGVVGKSELILGKDENGDGIREVQGAKAVAMIFPVLLHEVVKAVIEYIFANGLPQYTEKVNKEIMNQADRFEFEYWHKLLGPRLWKYLHDAIDFIVKERGNDYTIVAYLLQEISMLPPDKFLRFIDLILHDGNKAVVWLEKMLDRVEADLANQEDEEMEDVPKADFGNIQNLMGQIHNMLNKPEAEAKPEVLQHKPFNQMSIVELKDYINLALDDGEYEKAAEARDELEKREQQ